MLEGSLIGHYRVLRKLGEGGMGIVFEAVHEAIGRHVAIKILHPEYARNAEFASRFVNEARAVNRVDHPGLIQISDYGQLADGAAYIVMEYVKGETLRDRLEGAGGRMSAADSVTLSLQLADCLAAAHAEGIVHRDLKPDNVIVTKSGRRGEGERTKLLDFGIAKLLEDNRDHVKLKTKTHAIMGTPAYMSPEQCRGAGGVDHKSDVYSLGILMYLMSAGCPPFSAEGFGELLGKHMYEEPPPLAPLAPAAPASLVQLIHGMLHKDKSQRPSMLQVVSELVAIERELASPTSSGMMTVIRPAEVLPLAVSPPTGAAPSEYLSTLGLYSGQSRAVSRQRTVVLLGVSLGLLTVFGLGERTVHHWWNSRAVIGPEPLTAGSVPTERAVPLPASPKPEQNRAEESEPVLPPLPPVATPAAEAQIDRVLDQEAANGVEPPPSIAPGKPAKPSRIKNVPTEGEVLVVQGREKLSNKEFDGAAALFTLAVGLEPRNVDAVGGLGQASFAQGNDDAAARYLAAAIKLAPRRSVLYQELLCQSLYKLGRLKEAAEACYKRLTQAPRSETTLQILGRIEKELRAHPANQESPGAASPRPVVPSVAGAKHSYDPVSP